MKLFASTFASLALMVAVGQAAPLELKNVAANAKWVVNVDVDALRDSMIVKKSFETCEVLKNESGKHFDKIATEFGVDLRKDLHGITLYGADTDVEHGVALVYAKINRKPLLEKAQKVPGHKVVKYGTVEIHTATSTKGAKTHTHAGAFYKSDMMVFASSVKAVEDAIDVLDGKSPGLTDAKSPLAGEAYPGSIFVARSIAIPSEARIPISKQVESFRIALGEHAGKSFYRATAVMKSSQPAEQMKTIIDGFKAVGDLRFSGEADVKKLIDSLQTTVKDKTLSIQWDASTADVWNVVDKLAKKAAEHFKKGGPQHAKKGGERPSHDNDDRDYPFNR